ncbi:hypothetical protein GCM10011519_19210 [Marmoricola endophyticus]|uniref:Uncharacterized protein n=2 Tax=Marmoricola endophyticus TaxID=2040280 RepID=A0A917BLH3_9ACTN|nr:hypothetical protein GCM10011519_19210 [Marmoricola endophyticus]
MASALVKIVGIAVVIGLVLGGGIFVVVSALGVGSDESPTADLPAGGSSRSPLPTVALTPSGAPSSTTSGDPSESPSESPSEKPKGKLTLAAGQSQVAPGQQIDLTGQYAGKDGTVLQVQRRTGGSWQPFADVTVRVRGDDFSTYVVTSQNGEQRFRVLDQGTGTASNPVTVTVGG